MNILNLGQSLYKKTSVNPVPNAQVCVHPLYI